MYLNVLKSILKSTNSLSAGFAILFLQDLGQVRDHLQFFLRSNAAVLDVPSLVQTVEIRQALWGRQTELRPYFKAKE